jgi:RND family efflux transporter MFP subunit
MSCLIHVRPVCFAFRLLFLLACVGGMTGCRENSFVPPPPPEVGVARPVVRDVTRYTELAGRTEAVQVVEVRARIEGILLNSLASPGERVSEGDVLFQIDPALFVAERDAAAARVKRAEAELDVAQVNLKRLRGIANQGAASNIELLEAEAAVTTATADLEVTRRELAIKQLSVDYTEVRAPLTGEIQAGAPDIGSIVGGLGSGLLTHIYDTSSVHVWLSVPDRLFLQTASRDDKPDAELAYPIEIATEVDEGFPHAGVIDYVDPAADPETGTIRLRATVGNPLGVLKPGLFVRCRLVAGQIEDAVLVPEAALGSGQIGRYVLVIGESGAVEARPVQLGPRDGSLRVIESGLDAGDRVIVRGLLRARPGQTVTVVEEPIESARAEAP